MPIRNTTHILKNSDIVNRPLPSSLLKGEAIVNTADGIVYFSGVTTSTSEWTPAGTGTTANFFEVGSNLYDLRLRNRLTEYEGISTSGLVGKFLSGTTNGFVLADISSIAGVDSYVTGGTYNATTDAITLTLSEGKPNVVITGIADNYTTGATLIGSTAYFNRNDTLSAYTLDLSALDVNDTFTTGATYNANQFTFTRNDGGTYSVLFNTMTGLTVNGTLSAVTLDATNILSGGTNLSTIISDSEIYVTGGTVSVPATDNTNAGTIGLLYKGLVGSNTLPFEDTYTTGGTLNGSNLELDRNDGTTVTVDLSGLDVNDTFVTGVTYSNSLLTISRNEGQPNLTAVIDTVSGLTVSNLTAGRVVYVGTGGLLTDEGGFEYNATTDTLSSVNLNLAGDAVIQGSLTVFGQSISAFTSELYVEDPNVTLNYNPTGSTIVTSVGAGLTIQDGNGVTGGSVNLDIIRMQNLTGLTATNIPDVTEYTAVTGYANRGWITQLNDIVIRSTDVADDGSAGDINGVRVLAEFDILDGGTY